MDKNCGNCEHSGEGVINLLETQRGMVCRRYPPTQSVFVATEPMFGDGPKPFIATMWPKVQTTDSCGEFTPRVTAPEFLPA